ncbi:CRTAC1 family protein [Alteromonas facilis]|uniref:CRTAC1 family protein n=1 Tax=Alteromonas facilis TaxID=2048004 RepID=UPI000C292ECB|nr:CRTAC1 family protein [Alteromonas facilis]
MSIQSVFIRVLPLSVLSAIFLVACGGSGDNPTTSVPPPASPQPTNPPAPLVSYTVTEIQQTSSPLPIGGCLQSSSENVMAFNDVSNAAGLCYSVDLSAQDSIPARVAGGIAVNDIDNDGLLDLYVTHGRNQKGKLLAQQDTLNFLDITIDAGISVLETDHSSVFVDIDHDGDQDLISYLEASPYIQIFANQGGQRFNDISHLVDLTLSKVAYSTAVSDIDLDNDLDIFITHWDPENEQHRWEFLWRQESPGVYKDVSDTLELEPFNKLADGESGDEFSFTPAFADINDDKYPDLLIAADWGTSQYLVNQSGEAFKDETIPVVVSDRAGMGAAVADYDNDGDLDWFVSAIGDTREEFLTIGLFDGNRLYQNDGNGNFLNMTDYAGVRQGYWAWGSCFADFNNDGFADLLVVNGYNGWTEEQQQSGNFDHFENTRALLYINQHDGTFSEQGEELGINHTDMGRGLVCYDYDRDGDIDALIANSGLSPTLYRNDSFADGNNFINIQLSGLRANSQSVGARIYITAGELNLMQELQLGGQYVSQAPVEAHFGIANANSIEEIRIQWPGLDVEDTVLNDIPANRFVTIEHPDK